jgi:hypothetical protein
MKHSTFLLLMRYGHEFSQYKILYCSIAVLFVAVSAASAQTRPETLSDGLKNGTYRNSILGIELKVPEGWHSPTTDELEPAMKAGKEDAKVMTSKGVRDEGNLDFAVMKKPAGSTENSVFGLATAKQPSELYTATMIAEATKDGFSRHPDYKSLGKVSTERIGGRDFAMVEMGINPFPKQRMRFYIVREKEFAITIVLTYWNAEDLAEMMNSLRSIKFSRK